MVANIQNLSRVFLLLKNYFVVIILLDLLLSFNSFSIMRFFKNYLLVGTANTASFLVFYFFSVFMWHPQFSPFSFINKTFFEIYLITSFLPILFFSGVTYRFLENKLIVKIAIIILYTIAVIFQYVIISSIYNAKYI